jgi:RNA polymerase-binding transcription factor DksA
MPNKKKPSRRKCSLCGGPISAARLEALPDVSICVECAKKHPPKFDPRTVELSESSKIDRTGFAPSD